MIYKVILVIFSRDNRVFENRAINEKMLKQLLRRAWVKIIEVVLKVSKGWGVLAK